jgi:hypothetical protein
MISSGSTVFVLPESDYMVISLAHPIQEWISGKYGHAAGPYNIRLDKDVEITPRKTFHLCPPDNNCLLWLS